MSLRKWQEPAIYSLTLVICSIFLFLNFNEFSMWFDEIYLVNGALKYNFLNPDTFAHEYELIAHPPFYYVVLQGWMELAGQTDFVLRLPTVWAVLLTAAFIYRLAKDTTGQQFTGVAAALILCSFDFIQYYAHQTHNYGFLLLFSTTLLFFFLRWMRQPNSRLYLIAIGVSVLLMMYTHYYAAALILAINIYAVFALKSNFKAVFRLIGVQAIAALMYVPWLPAVYAVTIGKYGASGTIPTGQPSNWATVADTFNIMMSGLPILFLILIGGGFLWQFSRVHNRRWQSSFLYILMIAVIAIAISLLVNLRYRTFLNRRIIYVLVGAAVLAAMSLSLLDRRVRWPALAALVTLILIMPRSDALPGNWLFRQTLEFVDEKTAANELIFIEITEQSPLNFVPYDYYAGRYLSDNKVISFEDNVIDNEHKRSVFANDIISPYLWARDRFWVLTPDREVIPQHEMALSWEDGLQDKRFEVSQSYRIGWHTLSLYEAVTEQSAFIVPGTLTDSDKVQGATFGNRIVLENYDIESRNVSPDSELPVWLEFHTEQPLDNDYAIGLYLLGDNGLVAQTDGDPTHLGTILPTQFWPVETSIRGTYAITLGPDIPPGQYTLNLAIYRRSDLARLSVDADHSTDNLLQLTSLDIEAAQ